MWRKKEIYHEEESGHTKEFNKTGQLIRKESWSMGYGSSETQYEYDSENRLTRKIWIHKFNCELLKHTTIIEYGKAICREFVYLSHRFSDVNSDEYLFEGIIKWEEVNELLEVNEKRIINGKVVFESKQDMKSGQRRRTVSRQFEGDLLVHEKIVDAGEWRPTDNEYGYEDNRLIRKTEFDEYESHRYAAFQILYTHDNKGRVIKEETYGSYKGELILCMVQETTWQNEKSETRISAIPDYKCFLGYFNAEHCEKGNIYNYEPFVESFILNGPTAIEVVKYDWKGNVVSQKKSVLSSGEVFDYCFFHREYHNQQLEGVFQFRLNREGDIVWVNSYKYEYAD